MEIKSLIEQKGKLYEQLREAAGVPEKDYDEKKVDAINDDITKLTQKIRSLENANKILSEQKDTEVKEEVIEKIKEDSEAKFRKFLLEGRSGEQFVINTGKPETEQRDNQFYKGTTTAGGYLVPDLVGPKLAGARAHIGGMVTPGLCDRRTVANGQKLTFPTYDDTGVKSSIIAEKTTMATGTDVTYGTAVLEFFKLTTAFVKVSKELIQDSIFDVVGHILDLLAKRQARGENYYLTIAGDGTGDPYSIQRTSTKGVDAAKRGLTRANLVDLIYSVNRAYRDGAAWQMNDSTIGYIRKLSMSTTSYGDDLRPLWQESIRAGEPALLEGYPVVANNDVDAIASYNQSVFFGDFSTFMILDALPWTITRVDELYAATDEIGFNLAARIAGNKVDGGTPYKHIRHANT